MKKSLLFKSVIFAAVASFAVACDDDVNLGAVDTGNLAVPDNNVVYVTDAQGQRNYSSLDLRNSLTSQLVVNAPSSVASDTKVTFAYDPTVLSEYNTNNGYDYEAIPESFVAFANGGVTTLKAGEIKATIDYTLTSDGSLDASKSYVLPVRVKIEGDAQLGETDGAKVIFVNDLSSLPDATKYVKDENGNLVPGIKIFSVMEVNDTNPLNNLPFTLKSSGKPLIDAVVLFSSNININSQTGKVYVRHNENNQAIFSNYDKYIKPLKDRGMKVYLSILGNGDIAGISSLADETAKEFAKEVKNVCDTYNLDGVFWDDEYSKEITGEAPPGFYKIRNTPEGYERASYLLYQVWKLQPHRDNIAYCFSSTGQLRTVEGVTPGEYCRYALHNYAGSWDMSIYYPGMQRSQMGLYSQELNLSNLATLAQLQQMRADGYGCHMIFALDPRTQAEGGNRIDWYIQRQHQALENCAKAFYDDELVDDGTRSQKDWL